MLSLLLQVLQWRIESSSSSAGIQNTENMSGRLRQWLPAKRPNGISVWQSLYNSNGFHKSLIMDLWQNIDLGDRKYFV